MRKIKTAVAALQLASAAVPKLCRKGRRCFGPYAPDGPGSANPLRRVVAGCERPLEQRRTSGGKELRPVAPLAFGVRAFSALPRHFLRSRTTDEASSGTEDSSSQKVSPGWGSSYRHPPRAEMPSGPVLLPSTPPFPPLVVRWSSAGPPLVLRWSSAAPAVAQPPVPNDSTAPSVADEAGRNPPCSHPSLLSAWGFCGCGRSLLPIPDIREFASPGLAG